DEQLASIRNTESVNQQLFDSLHAELLKYRDNFLHESLQKPFIHDLVYLYDHLNGLCDQLSGAAQEKVKRSRVSQWRDNLENAIHSLVEILHRFDVREIEPRERVDRAFHRMISFEPPDFPEDLGTTFSAMAHIDNYGKPQIIPNAETERITPSVIFFDGSNVIVGTVAKNNAVADPEKIVDFVKREIGKPKEQFHRELNGKVYSAEELSALIIRKLKADAEKYLDQPVTDAVITVPAYFNDAERTATITAGQLAGLNVLQIINEPTAAALAYGLDKLDENHSVFVFDLGGGTFDVTIMRILDHKIEMIATNGDHRLGGKDWDD